MPGANEQLSVGRHSMRRNMLGKAYPRSAYATETNGYYAVAPAQAESCQCGFSTTARNNARGQQSAVLATSPLFWFSSKSIPVSGVSVFPSFATLGNQIMPVLLRRTDRSASSKVFVTTTGHEKFLSQAALALTAIIAIIAVLVSSILALLVP